MVTELPTLRAEMSLDQVVAVLDVAPVDRDQDVAGFESSLGGAGVGHDRADHHASALESIDARHGGVLPGLELDADRAANHLVGGADEVVIDLGEDIRRHGEADALRAHRLGIDGGVHADDRAGHIDERTAGVAGVDGGVGLDELLKLVDAPRVFIAIVDRTILGRDDAGPKRSARGRRGCRWRAPSRPPALRRSCRA